VDAQYYTLAGKLLQHVPQGARPVFGTHDLSLIARIQAKAASLRLGPQAYEFHMLYGIRSAEQRNLAAAGAKVGVLISYGSAWFAWYMRRLAERPANIWFVLRNLV
jgi:proline dehydrogenase